MNPAVPSRPQIIQWVKIMLNRSTGGGRGDRVAVEKFHRKELFLQPPPCTGSWKESGNIATGYSPGPIVQGFSRFRRPAPRNRGYRGSFALTAAVQPDAATGTSPRHIERVGIVGNEYPRPVDLGKSLPSLTSVIR